MRVISFILLTALSCSAWGETSASESNTPKLKHDSEAGIILASGNSETQTYSIKQITFSQSCHRCWIKRIHFLFLVWSQKC